MFLWGRSCVTIGSGESSESRRRSGASCGRLVRRVAFLILTVSHEMRSSDLVALSRRARVKRNVREGFCNFYCKLYICARAH